MKKNNYKKWELLLISSIIMVAMSVTIFATQVILYYSKEAQANTNWCWVASARNAVKYSHNPIKTQPEGVIYIKGSCVNEAGSLLETKNVADYFSQGEIYYANTARGTTTGVKSFTFLTDKIDNDRVTVLSAGYYEGGERKGGHSVSMHGYYSYGSYASMIWYFDPWVDAANNYTPTEHECSYNSFLSGTYNGRIYDGTVYATN
ncbi:MAG: hypothetical protein K5927_02275 [Lachnospiraceae bacterium]|nr:hypothetical protein [Lachnospiraceae bacterium]